MLRVLGVADIGADGRTIAVNSRHQRALLAALVLDRGRIVTIDRLVELIWADDVPADPTGALQSHISRLRRLLPSGTEIEAVAAGYQLDAATATDVATFERRITEIEAGDSDPRLELIDETCALWRGDPFVDLPDDDRAIAEAMRLRAVHFGLRESRAETLLSLDRPGEAVAELDALRRADPLSERTVELLMRSLVAAGRPTDALRAFEALRAELADIGLEPSTGLRVAEQFVLAGEGPSIPNPVESVIGLPTSSFHGRDTDLAEVDRLLRGGRLVTVLGPGGVGKTRLSLHVAAAAETRYPEGVVVLELAALRDGTSIIDLAGSALAVEPVAGRPPLEGVIETLRGRRVLLLVDNCEHVVDDAAVLVETVLVGAPGVDVLATSREPLDIDDERCWRLRPLPVDVGDAAAVQLFLDRATAARPELDLDDATIESARGICRRLDGLPLAIELAAARLRTMSLADVAAGLDERFAVLNRGRRTVDPRHRSLWAVVDWSAAHLAPTLLESFVRLAVFADTFTIDGATAVCDGDTHTVGDAVADLVDRSLLTEVDRTEGGETRFRFLESIRAYARERLGELGMADETYHRHDEWAVTRAEELTHRYATIDEAAATDELLADWAELREAHGRGMHAGNVDSVLRISATLHYWSIYRMDAEAAGWALAAASRFADSGHRLLAVVAGSASGGAWQGGDITAARRLADASARTAVDDAGRAAAAEAEADLALFDGRLADAEVAYLASSRLGLAVGDRHRGAYCLVSAALPASYAGDVDRARDHIAAGRAAAPTGASETMVAWYDYSEGECLAEHDPDAAVAALRRAVDAADRRGSRFVAGVAGLTLVTVQARGDDPAGGIGDLRSLIERWRDRGAWNQQWITLRSVIDVLVKLDDHEAAARLLGAAAASDLAARPYGMDAARLDACRAELQRVLGPVFGEAMAAGAAMDDDGAVAFVLERLDTHLPPG